MGDPALRVGGLVGLALALAGASLLAPSAPTTDPWGWLVWGREILHLDLSTAVAGAPSWKPLPMLATTLLALTGSAAPTLWLLLERAASLLSLVMGYRLASRLGGRRAGALAALGLALSGGWMLAVAQGYTEAFTAGLLFLAIERELDGHPSQALALGALIALARPEAWPLLCGFALIEWRRGRLSPGLALPLLASVPLLWIVPDWIGSGKLFHANAVARQVVPTGAGAAADALRAAVLEPPIPLTASALAFAVLDPGGRTGTYGRIGLFALGWCALLAALMLAVGYPASGRFFDAPMALICVLGAVAAVRLGAMLSSRSRAPAALLPVVVVALAISLGIDRTTDEADAALVRGRLVHQLHGVIDRAGPAALRRCGRTLVPVKMGWLRGAVAWDLNQPIRRVRGVWTSVPDYVEELGAHQLEGAPAPPRGRVWIGMLGRNAALLLPFQGAPATPIAGPRPAMRVLSVDGRWTAYAAGGPPCVSGAA